MAVMVTFISTIAFPDRVCCAALLTKVMIFGNCESIVLCGHVEVIHTESNPAVAQRGASLASHLELCYLTVYNLYPDNDTKFEQHAICKEERCGHWGWDQWRSCRCASQEGRTRSHCLRTIECGRWRVVSSSLLLTC